MKNIKLKQDEGLAKVCHFCGGRFTVYATHPMTIIPICPCGEPWREHETNS